MKGLFTALALVACLACGSATSPSSATPMSGTWRGSVEGNPTGPGTLRMEITQRGSVLSGTWSVSFPSQGASDSGQLAGALSGNAVSLTLSGGAAVGCRASFEGTLAGADVRGTYATIECTPTVGGAFNMTRQ